MVLFLLSLLTLRSDAPGLHRYSVTFWGSFDTVTTIVAYAESAEAFRLITDAAIDRFSKWSMLYDSFEEYDGVNNVATINRMAGVRPVRVDQDLFDLIVFCMRWEKKSNGTFQIALGPVTSLWNDAIRRAQGGEGIPPSRAALESAALKTDPRKVRLDPASRSVFLEESGMKLDLGAAAKGYAVERMSRLLHEMGLRSFLISSGGNIRACGAPPGSSDGGWRVGIQNPDKSPFDSAALPLRTVVLSDAALVTSGDYQRYFYAEGKRFHHLVDPETLTPPDFYRSVTVMAGDSGDADVLSTLLFLSDYAKSSALCKRFGAKAVWVFPNGEVTEFGME